MEGSLVSEVDIDYFMSWLENYLSWLFFTMNLLGIFFSVNVRSQPRTTFSKRVLRKSPLIGRFVQISVSRFICFNLDPGGSEDDFTVESSGQLHVTKKGLGLDLWRSARDVKGIMKNPARVKIHRCEERIFLSSNFAPQYFVGMIHSWGLLNTFFSETDMEEIFPSRFIEFFHYCGRISDEVVGHPSLHELRKDVLRFVDENQDRLDSIKEKIYSGLTDGWSIEKFYLVVRRNIPRKPRRLDGFFQVRHIYGAKVPIAAFWVFPLRLSLSILTYPREVFRILYPTEETLDIDKVWETLQIVPPRHGDLFLMFRDKGVVVAISLPKLLRNLRLMFFPHINVDIMSFRRRKNKIELLVRQQYNVPKIPVSINTILTHTILGLRIVSETLYPFTRSDKAFERFNQKYSMALDILRKKEK